MPNILEKKVNKNDSLNAHSSDQLNNVGESNQTLNSSLEQNQTNQLENKSNGLMTTLGSLLPFAPMLFEQMTGQKVPMMTGTLGEMQQNLSQLTTGLQQFSSSLAQVINNQQQIFQRIVNLEKNASQQILSLDKRIENLASIKLTHEKERKQIEYNQTNSALTENEEY